MIPGNPASPRSAAVAAAKAASAVATASATDGFADRLAAGAADSEPRPTAAGAPRAGNPAATPGELPLDRLAKGRAARIVRLDPDAAGQPAERARQLADIGFAPGEVVSVAARAWPGGDPMVVRVGVSRFALRRAEAACVRVELLP